MRICSSRARLGSGVLIGALLLSLSLTSFAGATFASAAQGETCQRIGLPAYFYPGATWTQALSGEPTGEWLTMNPASGPGAQRDPNYVAAVKQAHKAGARVLGYVHTSYGSRPIADAEAEVSTYKSWYAVDGIFVDEVAASPASLTYYQNLATFIRGTPGRLVELNPGTVPDPGYFSVGDSIVVFEGDYASYQSATFPSWVSQQPPRKVAHLVYAAPDQAALTTTLNVAQARGAGRVYVTNDTLPNPWDTLPPYWTQETASLASTCTTPSPLVVDVTQLGAHSDGSADSTPAFQAAREQLDAAGGGELDIPAGIYAIRPDSVFFDSDINIKGTGNPILRGSADGYALFEIGGTDIQISGITLDGSNRVVHGLEIDRASSHIAVSDTTVSNISQTTDSSNPNFNQTPVGIRVEGDGAHMTFESDTINNVVAINTGGAAWPHKIARGMLLDTGGGANDVAHDVLVHASHFSNVAPKDDGDCLVAQNGVSDIGLRIVGNSFDFCHKRAIKLQVSGVVVQNNTINNPFLGNNVYDTYPETYINGHPSFDMFSAIGVFGSRVQIVGNTIGGIGSYYNGLELDGPSTLTGIVISNNRIANGPNAEIGAPESSIRAFVELASPSVTNNALKHAQVGLNFDIDPAAPTIQGNTFTNITTQVNMPGNLVANPGYESPITATADSNAPPSVGFWTRVHPGAAQAGSPAPVHFGLQSGSVQTFANQTGAFFLQDFSNFPFNASYTLSFWVFPQSGQQSMGFEIGWDRGAGTTTGGFGLTLDPSGTTIGDSSSVATAPAVSYGQWHQVSVVEDSCAGTHRWYLDGQPLATTTSSSTPPQLGSLILGETSGTSPGDTQFYWDDVSLQAASCGAPPN